VKQSHPILLSPVLKSKQNPQNFSRSQTIPLVRSRSNSCRKLTVPIKTPDDFIKYSNNIPAFANIILEAYTHEVKKTQRLWSQQFIGFVWVTIKYIPRIH